MYLKADKFTRGLRDPEEQQSTKQHTAVLLDGFTDDRWRIFHQSKKAVNCIVGRNFASFAGLVAGNVTFQNSKLFVFVLFFRLKRVSELTEFVINVATVSRLSFLESFYNSTFNDNSVSSLANKHEPNREFNLHQWGKCRVCKWLYWISLAGTIRLIANVSITANNGKGKYSISFCHFWRTQTM